MAELFTKRQGEYLTFLHLYTLLNKRAPAEADFQDYFGVSSAAVHQMIVSLESRGLIQRTPGQARSIRLLVAPERLPPLIDAAQPPSAHSANRQTSFEETYPNIALWVQEHGWIELGYDYNTGSCARAIDKGGLAWGGGQRREALDDWVKALERGIGEAAEEFGLTGFKEYE